MSSKQKNTNYDILDKILADADRTAGQHGEWVDLGNGQGKWVTTKEEFDQLTKNVDVIEKYLRS